MAEVNVRFAQDILRMLVIFSLFCDPKLTKGKIALLQTVNDLNALFQLKQCMCRLGHGQILLTL